MRFTRYLSCLPIVFGLIACEDKAPRLLVASSSSQDNSASQSLSSQRISSENSTKKIKSPCVIQVKRMVKLKPELGGALDDVKVQLGDAVKKGQLLATLRTRELLLSMERQSVQSQLVDEKIKLTQTLLQKAQQEWEVQKVLYVQSETQTNKNIRYRAMPKEAISLEERRSELSILNLQKKDLELQTQQIQRQISLSEIRSPLDGIILSRNAEIGMVVAPGGSSFNGTDILFEIGDPTDLKAECSARETEVDIIQIGKIVKLKLDGVDKHLQMKIVHIAPAISNQGGMTALSYWADIPKDIGFRVLPGMHGVAQMQIE